MIRVYEGEPSERVYGASDDDGVGILARVQDAQTYYRFSLDQQRGFARLMARVHGTFVTLAANDSYPGYASNTWTELALTVQGSNIEARVNGQLVLSATDTQIPSGAVGLYSWGSAGVRFDDLLVAP